MVKIGVDRVLPFVSLPQRIEEGPWWFAANDFVSDSIFEGAFEKRERAFVERFLKPGMVMIDVGAHHGLYALIAAKRVGAAGRVIAFEPSPRERRRLERHRRINRMRQVTVVDRAVGAEPGRATLFLPPRRSSGFNSLQPAAEVRARSEPVAVEVTTIDRYLAHSSVDRVDLIKLDIEGGELHALKGAARTIAAHRPAILCEVEDERTVPWGYKAEQIIDLMKAQGYHWFLPRPGGRLIPLPGPGSETGSNLVALPAGRADVDLLARM